MHPTTRQALEQLQATYARASHHYRELIALAREADAFSYDACPMHLQPLIHAELELSRGLGRVARNAVRCVVGAIQTELANGQHLDLAGADEIVRRYFEPADSTIPTEAFSCVALGEQLHDAYASRAASMARRQAAARVVEHFGLAAGDEPVMRRGHVVLSVRMYCDTWAGRLSYSNDRILVEACYSLQDVVRTFDHAMANRLADGIRELVAVGTRNRWAPERHAYGPIGPIELRAYQSKVEFLIPVALAAQVNAFLSEHAPGFRVPARNAA